MVQVMIVFLRTMIEKMKKEYCHPYVQVVEIECGSSLLGASTETENNEIETSSIEYEEW